MEKNDTEKEIRIGNFTFERVVSGPEEGFLYNLKSPLPVKCFGCNHSITTTTHVCRIKHQFRPNVWMISRNDMTSYAVRKENFKRIMKIMLESRLLVLCDRMESHLMKNVFTFCPVEESHRLKAGDRFVLPPTTHVPVLRTDSGSSDDDTPTDFSMCTSDMHISH